MGDSNDASDNRAMGGNDNRVASLIPFTAGQSGNPKGAPRTAGGLIKHRFNACARMEKSALEDILSDPHSPAASVIAAQRTIVAMEDRGYESLHSITQIMEHTSGRAINAVVVQHIDATSADDQLRALKARVIASGTAVPLHGESTERDMIEHTPGLRVDASEADQGSAEPETRTNEGRGE